MSVQTERDLELIRFWSAVGKAVFTALAHLGAGMAGLDHREFDRFGSRVDRPADRR